MVECVEIFEDVRDARVVTDFEIFSVLFEVSRVFLFDFEVDRHYC